MIVNTITDKVSETLKSELRKILDVIQCCYRFIDKSGKPIEFSLEDLKNKMSLMGNVTTTQELENIIYTIFKNSMILSMTTYKDNPKEFYSINEGKFPNRGKHVW